MEKKYPKERTKRFPEQKRKLPAQKTTWGHVADWYEEHLLEKDTYHAEVILPNLLRTLAPSAKDVVLDLPCGQGYFTSKIAGSVKKVVAVDVADELISYAERNKLENVTYLVSPSHQLHGVADKSVNKIIMVLGIQNIERVAETFSECARVLKKQGELHIVMNHPAFRIPKESSWEWDTKSQLQYRRIERYLSESQSEIDMHPGKFNDEKHKKVHTISFHRPLQFYFKLLGKQGFAVDRLEEWISHRKSDSGPRMLAENRARKEFPLFLYLRAKLLSEK